MWLQIPLRWRAFSRNRVVSKMPKLRAHLAIKVEEVKSLKA